MVALKASVGLERQAPPSTKSVKFHVVDDPWVVATAAFVKLGGVLAHVLWAMLDPAQRRCAGVRVPSRAAVPLCGR